MKPIILAILLISPSNFALAQYAPTEAPPTQALPPLVPPPKGLPPPPPPDLKSGYPAPNPRIFELQARLTAISQAQQSLYQQFQMVQELRRNEIAGTYPQVLPGSGLSNLPPISYDETIRLQKERQDRLTRYERDLDELYSRYAELDEQKNAVLDELIELGNPSE